MHLIDENKVEEFNCYYYVQLLMRKSLIHLFGRNTSTRPGMISRYLMAEFCEPVCPVRAWYPGEQEQEYPAHPRARHPRGQFPVRSIKPFMLYSC